MPLQAVSPFAPRFGWGRKNGFRNTLAQTAGLKEKGIILAAPNDMVTIGDTIPRKAWFRFNAQTDDRCYRWEVRYEKGLAHYTLTAYPPEALPPEPETNPAKVYTEEEKAAILDQLLEELENLPDTPVSQESKAEKPETPFLWRLQVTKKPHDYDASNYNVRWTDASGKAKEAKLRETKRKAGNLLEDLEHDLTMANAMRQLMGVVTRMNVTMKHIIHGEFPNLTDPDWEAPVEEID